MARKLKRHGIRVCAKNRQQSKHKTPLDSSVTGCVKNASIRNTQRAGRIATRRREDQAMPVRAALVSRRRRLVRRTTAANRRLRPSAFGRSTTRPAVQLRTGGRTPRSSESDLAAAYSGTARQRTARPRPCSARTVIVRPDLSAEVSRSVNGPRRERSGFAVYSINNRVSYTSI